MTPCVGTLVSPLCGAAAPDPGDEPCASEPCRRCWKGQALDVKAGNFRGVTFASVHTGCTHEQLPLMGEGDNAQLPPPRKRWVDGAGQHLAPRHVLGGLWVGCIPRAPLRAPCEEAGGGAAPGHWVPWTMGTGAGPRWCRRPHGLWVLSQGGDAAFDNPDGRVGEASPAPSGRSTPTPAAPARRTALRAVSANPAAIAHPLPAAGTGPGEHARHRPAPNCDSPGSGCSPHAPPRVPGLGSSRTSSEPRWWHGCSLGAHRSPYWFVGSASICLPAACGAA